MQPPRWVLFYGPPGTGVGTSVDTGSILNERFKDTAAQGDAVLWFTGNRCGRKVWTWGHAACLRSSRCTEATGGVLFFVPLLYQPSPPPSPPAGKTLVARALAAHASRFGKKVSFFMRKGADVLSK